MRVASRSAAENGRMLPWVAPAAEPEFASLATVLWLLRCRAFWQSPRKAYFS